MRILAFDQATKVSGYCVIDDGKIVTYGNVDLHKYKDMQVRLPMMIKELVSIIECYKPDMVFVEDVELIQNVQAMINLAKLVGAIIGYCTINDIKIKTYLPTQWRSLVGIPNGRGIKRDTVKAEGIKFAEKQTGKQDIQEDTAEAIAICCAAWIDINKE